MSNDRVVDTHQFQRAAQALRTADKTVTREFTAALRDVAKPFGQYVLLAGAKELPSRGGLSYRVASGRVSTQVSPFRASITVRAKGSDLAAMNRGQLRHPVFGRKKWVQQKLQPGAFSRPFSEHAATVRGAMLAAGQRVLDQVQKEAS